MRFTVSGAALALATGWISTADATPRYQPANLLGTGYSDRQIAPGVWNISGASAEPDGGHAIALYRAAQLVAAEHATQMRIVNQHILVERRQWGGFVREVADITVRAVHSDADLSACQMRHAEHCVTISVARTAAQFGPMLDQPATLAGVPSIKMAAAISTGPRRGPAVWTRSVAPLSPHSEPAVAAPPAEPLSPHEQGRRAALAALAASGTSPD